MDAGNGKIPTKRERRGGRSTRNEAPRETVGVAVQRFFESIPFARGMKTRILGRTGLKVSEIGFGAWAIGGNAHGNSYGPPEDGASIAALRRAGDLGVNFIGTAHGYGWGPRRGSHRRSPLRPSGRGAPAPEG